MVTAQAANLLVHVDALRKHEQVFLNLHKQLIDEIVATGRKYSKFIPGSILGEKGIRYESAVLGKRVDYERRNENGYRSARAGLLQTLRALGLRNQAAFFFQHWKAIERMLPNLEKAILNPGTWADPKMEETVYNAALKLYQLQQQIVEALVKIEQMLQKK